MLPDGSGKYEILIILLQYSQIKRGDPWQFSWQFSQLDRVTEQSF